MAFPHPQSRNKQYRKKEKPDTAGVVVSIRRRIIDVAEYRNTEEDVNPAKNPARHTSVRDIGWVGGYGHDVTPSISQFTILER
jgi:hypothetical protein